MLATSVQEQLEMGVKSTAEVPDSASQTEKHCPVLMKLICDELNVETTDILDFELCLADAVPAVRRWSSPLIINNNNNNTKFI